MYEFHWPTKTLFDPGLIDSIDEHITPSASAHHLLLVAPQEDWIQPLLGRMVPQLKAAGWEGIESFAEVEPNPSWKTVTSGTNRAKEIGATAILAIGGGSSMDAGKVIAERCEANFLCTIPTTAGTGGEISPWAVITNLETREKDSVVAKWPNLALLDPNLTLTVPPKTTLFTGIDAFIHGLEAYVSSTANPITDALALAGMELIAPHLRGAVEDSEQLEARSAMLQGSLLTGAAMLHAGLGLMHAIGNVTGGLYHQLPHGLILMRCMDAVLEYNRPNIDVKLSTIKPILEQIQTEVDSLFEQLSLPDVEIRQADLATLARRALANVNAKTNPRPATQKDIETIVQQSFVIQ
jgi:alcohol dehydrogenase class IV